MGSLYSLSPVYMNYRQTARKPARQQAHEALSLVEAGGCDLYAYACVCMLIYVWVCVCAWACLLSGVGVRTSVMMQRACLLLYVYICMFVFTKICVKVHLLVEV